MVYSKDYAKICKDLYEKYGNLTKVVEEFFLITGVRVADNTIKRWLKYYLDQKFPYWYNKYKLMGNYSWEDARNWKKLYEQFGSFRAVEELIKQDFDSDSPYESIIRDYVYKYITQVLEQNFEEWINNYNTNIGNTKYKKVDFFYWKNLYETFGSLREVRNQLQIETNENPPDAMTIRNGLRNIMGNNYDNWLKEHAKKSIDDEEIKRCKELFEEEGTYNAVRKKTGHDTKVLRKHFKKNLGDDYNNWYDMHSKHHLRKYNENEILEWTLLFEELGSFPSVSSVIIDTYGTKVSPSVIRKTIKRYFEENGVDYQEWLIEFSLSENLVLIGKLIHQILELYFMLNFKERNLLAFYEVNPNLDINDLVRVDNSLIINQKLINFLNLDISGNIIIINIDYILSPNIRRLYPKLRKGYHNENVLLIIVPIVSEISSLEIPLDIDYKENIKIINVDYFFRLMNFDYELLDNVNYAISLAKRAPYSPSAFNELSNMAERAKNELKNKFGTRSIQQKEFESELKKIF